MTQILVVEDDASIRLGLEDTLCAKGYGVEVSSRGDTALARVQELMPDLIVLDIMLPDMDGFEVCRQLKASRGPVADIPVIILSARGAELDRVRGLELGADDYVTKPFSLMELLARVAAVLRRTGLRDTTVEVVRFGQVEICFKTQQVTKGLQEVSLPSRGFAILAALAKCPGEVVSREELMNQVWGLERYPNTRTVDNHIVKLRKLVEPDPERPVFLRTVHGIGYRFVPDGDS